MHTHIQIPIKNGLLVVDLYLNKIEVNFISNSGNSRNDRREESWTCVTNFNVFALLSQSGVKK